MQDFARDYESKSPKAVASLRSDFEMLLTLYDFPAEHWKHLRSTNPIESTFATVKHRQNATKGAGSRAAGLAMAFELMRLAQKSWRRLDAPQLLPQVRARGAVSRLGSSRCGGKPSPLLPPLRPAQVLDFDSFPPSGTPPDGSAIHNS